MNLLAEGTVFELNLPGVQGGYRLIRKDISPSQTANFYIRGPFELGCEILIGRACVSSIAKQLKEQGEFVIVASYTGHHPLYQFADEFWGIRNWNSNKPEESKTVKEIDEVNTIKAVHKGKTTHNHRLIRIPEPIEHSLYGLLVPSKKAIEITKTITREKPFIVMSPTTRDKFECRDFHSWEKLYDNLIKFGIEIFITCPKNNSVSLPCTYIEDIAGPENRMDLEIAFYSKALAGFSSNTASAGIMICSNISNIFIFGGTGGFPPGWHGLINNLHKLSGYKTKLFEPQPVIGNEDHRIISAISLFEKEIIAKK